jgi:hypothetical protein
MTERKYGPTCGNCPALRRAQHTYHATWWCEHPLAPVVATWEGKTRGNKPYTPHWCPVVQDAIAHEREMAPPAERMVCADR